MTNCPCCSNQMLRHVRSQKTYWFCRHCWQEMPNLIPKENNLKHDKLRVFSQFETPVTPEVDFKGFPVIVFSGSNSNERMVKKRENFLVY